MINLSKVTKRFDSTVAVDNVSLDVPAGTIHGVLGRSGAGKSTLLRTVNLLERPESGRVNVAGRELSSLPAAQLREARASIGMVFQHFHLLHNRTVAANVALPLKLHGFSKSDRNQRVTELLELVGLSDQARKHPSQLSGGQRQRVAIARALAPRPDVLLSDESTSALDPQTTAEILDLFARLRDKLGLTILLITHELDVITRICDSASVMDSGRFVEDGSVADLLARPGSALAEQAFRLADPDHTVGVHVEVTFTGDSVGEPVLAALVRHFDVNASITDASVQTVAQGTVGRLRLQLPPGDATDKAISWLGEQGYGVRLV